MFFQIQTLGCKVNQYESEQVRQALLAAGWLVWSTRNEQTIGPEVAEDAPESASETQEPTDETLEPLDVLLVNSCAVTSESEAKSRKMVRQLIKRWKPRRCVVFGCSAANGAAQFEAIPGVTDVVTGQETGGNRVAAVLLKLGVEPGSFLPVLEQGLYQFGSRHRAYLKVQDGCKQFCTYCLIPYLRNELSSVPLDEVQEEAAELIVHGYKELVITGIHLGFYGLNLRSRATCVWEKTAVDLQCGTAQTQDASRFEGKITLATLMERLAQLAARSTQDGCPVRLRISSIEAHEATDDLLAVMAANRQVICPHLHLSMQSGSPTVMRRMNRPGTLEQYIERCENARKWLDEPALTTDCIVGFPGETEQEFLETCETVRRIGFSKIHIFPYSPRKGTPAATMPNQVPAVEKQRRAAFLAEIEKELHQEFLQRLKNHPQQFLLETFNAQTQTVAGTSEYYIHATFPGKAEEVGTFRLEAGTTAGEPALPREEHIRTSRC